MVIDLFCGLGGWADGFLAEGYRVIGFDNERHAYGSDKYPGQLVLQDVLTLHGSQFKDATVIVASPPCQAYSYRAMPWKRAKALPPPDNTLFDACFRIQREASEAAGRKVPLIVENVCGAQKWVGRARWHYGSFYLWGDVPALMPITFRIKNPSGLHLDQFEKTGKGLSDWTMKSAHACGVKVGGLDWNDRTRKVPGFRFDGSGGSFQTASVGVKQGGDWFGANEQSSISRRTGSRSHARKAASAYIAKIPFELARHIARSCHD